MTKGLFCFPRTLCLPGLPGFGFLARHRLEPGQHISLHECVGSSKDRKLDEPVGLF